MCGIFGWSLPESSGVSEVQRAIIAAILADRNDNRGGDSVGWLPIGATPEKRLGSMVAHASELAQHRDLFGHTRKATHGAISVENSHPFTFEAVTGCHNGIIYEGAGAYAVDSMVLFDRLSQGKSFEGLSGYGSIAWYDARYEGIRLCRMRSGELSVFVLTDGVGVVFSSTARAARDALCAAGVKATEYEVKQDRVHLVTSGKYYILPHELSLAEGRFSSLDLVRTGSDFFSAWTDETGESEDDEDTEILDALDQQGMLHNMDSGEIEDYIDAYKAHDFEVCERLERLCSIRTLSRAKGE